MQFVNLFIYLLTADQQSSVMKSNKMKNKRYYTVEQSQNQISKSKDTTLSNNPKIKYQKQKILHCRTIPKSNIKIVIIDKIDAPSTQIHNRPHSGHGGGIYIKVKV
jgi:hypothetical protein